jgi:hypothetical protein
MHQDGAERQITYFFSGRLPFVSTTYSQRRNLTLSENYPRSQPPKAARKLQEPNYPIMSRAR